MKLNLRKAAQVRGKLDALIKEADARLSPTASFSVFSESPEQDRERAAKEWNEQYARVSQLEDALQFIRAEVGAANAGSGINDLLTQSNRLIRDIDRLKRLSYCKGFEVDTTLAARLAHTRKLADNPEAYHRETVVQAEFLPAAAVEQAAKNRRELERTLVGLGDRVLELNVKTEITLPEHIVTTLTTEGLV